jgi:hypothetical protein
VILRFSVVQATLDRRDSGEDDGDENDSYDYDDEVSQASNQGNSTFQTLDSGGSDTSPVSANQDSSVILHASCILSLRWLDET